MLPGDFAKVNDRLSGSMDSEHRVLRLRCPKEEGIDKEGKRTELQTLSRMRRADDKREKRDGSHAGVNR